MIFALGFEKYNKLPNLVPLSEREEEREREVDCSSFIRVGGRMNFFELLEI